MKSTKSIGCDQDRPTALRLYIESEEKDPFERDIDALDLLTLQVLSDALRDNVKSRFSLKFFDADQVFVGGRQINIEKTSVELEVTFQVCGSVRVPLTCKIVDASGRTYKRILSEDEARKWVSASSFEGSNIDGTIYWIKSTRPSDSPTFSPQVYLALSEMLMVSGARRLEPPLTIEIRDARGRSFQGVEITFSEGKYQTRTDLADCAHLPFPVIVKLISQRGMELKRTIQRLQ